MAEEIKGTSRRDAAAQRVAEKCEGNISSHGERGDAESVRVQNRTYFFTMFFRPGSGVWKRRGQVFDDPKSASEFLEKLDAVCPGYKTRVDQFTFSMNDGKISPRTVEFLRNEYDLEFDDNGQLIDAGSGNYDEA